LEVCYDIYTGQNIDGQLGKYTTMTQRKYLKNDHATSLNNIWQDFITVKNQQERKCLQPRKLQFWTKYKKVHC